MLQYSIISLFILETDDKNRVTNYIEKPTIDYQVSMGIYAFSKRTLKFIPQNEYLDFPDLILKLIKANE